MTGPPSVFCRGVVRTYGHAPNLTAALCGVDLEVRSGEVVALVGPSGSGKSTLLHLIGAMDRCDEGVVEVDGRDLTQLEDAEAARFRRESIGFVFQFFNLVPTLRSLDNVALPARLAGVNASRARARAATLLGRVGLESRLDSFPDALSGGQQQRVALARALVNRPRLLLADEPTGALDRGTGGEMLELLGRMAREEETTLLIATHDEAVMGVATRVVRLEDGRIVEDRPR